MQLAILIFIFVYFDAIFAQCEDNEYSTVGVLDDINEEIYNDDESVNAYSIFLILIILIQLVNKMLMQTLHSAQQ